MCHAENAVVLSIPLPTRQEIPVNGFYFSTYTVQLRITVRLQILVHPVSVSNGTLWFTTDYFPKKTHVCRTLFTHTPSYNMKRMMTNDTDFGPSLHKPFLARMYDHAGIVSSALQNSVYWLLDHGCRVRTQNREEKEKQVTQPTAVSLQHDLPVSHTEQECLSHLSSNQTPKTDTHTLTDTYTDSEWWG